MNNKIKFTIIIPHKDIPILLTRCLNSIPKREDIQIIIIDDNSDESTVNFNCFPGYNRAGVEIYFSKEGKGAGFARNLGLQKARGKWIIFADADDFFLSSLVAVLNLYINSDADVIAFIPEIYNSETMKISNERDTWLREIFQNKNYSDKEILSLLVIPGSKIIKHSLIKRYTMEYEEIMCANDVMFSAKTAVYANKIIIDRKHIIYGLAYRNNSITTNIGKDHLYCRLFAAIRTNIFYKEQGCPFFRKQINRLFLSNAARFGKFEVLKVGWILFRNNLLFFQSPLSWSDKYYNSGLYNLYLNFWHAKW